jgi:hypothetical protein
VRARFTLRGGLLLAARHDRADLDHNLWQNAGQLLSMNMMAATASLATLPLFANWIT